MGDNKMPRKEASRVAKSLFMFSLSHPLINSCMMVTFMKVRKARRKVVTARAGGGNTLEYPALCCPHLACFLTLCSLVKIRVSSIIHNLGISHHFFEGD